MKCMGNCGTEIAEGLYCMACAGKPDKANYINSAPMAGFARESMPTMAYCPDEPMESRKPSGWKWLLLALLFAAVALGAFLFFGR